MADKTVVFDVRRPSTINMRSGRASTGAEAQHQFNVMWARLIARYRLREVPGRPEELAQIGSPELGVSLGYGCKTIRVRQMVGRKWVAHVDFQIGTGWGAELYAFLDSHFRFSPPTSPIEQLNVGSVGSGA